jgi:hypothetical protein
MRLTLVVAILFLSGCATTSITGFTDPDFQSKAFKSLVVVTPNLNLEYSSLLQGKVCNAVQGMNISCKRGLDLFPPTRTFDTDGIVRILNDNRIDGYLLLTYGGGSTQSQQIGTLAYGSATVFANTISAYGSSTPVMSFSRSDGYSIVLIDTQTFKKAWVGGAKTQAQGLANITDDVFTGSLGAKIVSVLKDAGHL